MNDYHALDFDLVTGNSVRAIADGQVVYAGWATGGWSSYGQIVIIDHQNGYQSLYAHLNGLDVSDNQWVQQEQKIGEAGGSGGWDPHLHFSLYHNASIADPGGPYGGCATVPEYFRGVQDYEDLVQDMDLTSEGGGPPPPDHSVQFYIDAHYGGGGYCYGDSEGNYNNLGGCPGYNDQISSVLLKSGWSVRVFKHENLGEPSRCFTSSDDDFANDTFDDGSQLNDQMSSFALYHQSNCPPPVTPPTADFDAWPQSGNAPLTVAFHNISSGDYTSCYWEYGDGNTGNSCDDYHDYTYDNPGTYTVRLTVNGPGGSDTRTRSNYITVNALPPTADFDAWPQSGNAPLTVAFHNISSGDYTSCYWEYGDGNTGNSCDGYHDYTYDNPGTYTVRLTVNGPGGSDTRTRYGYITVNVPPPTADFDASPLSGDGPLTVAFHNASSGSYTSCYWEYGDGSTSDWPYGYHFHTYASPGSYTVRLTVIGPGGSDTRTRYDYITVNPVDTEKPVVNWIAPVGDGEVYPVGDEVIQLEVNATDNVAVARVRFYRWDAVNEQWVEIGNDYSAPYQMNLDCSTLNEGWNEIDAEAYDTAGNSSDRKHIWLDRSTPRPDLHPYAPAGYSYPVVPSSVSGTHEVNTLYAGQTTYFDWHFVNSGNATASGNFHVELWVGDTRYVRYPYSDYGAGQSSGFDDWMETIPTPGWHTVRLITDPDNSVDESDENNNVWEGQFYWEPSGPLVYSAHTVDDDNTGESNGNGDGIVNCGETIELYVDLYNQGGSTATGVNATISTSDPYVTWLYNTDSSYPDIPDGGTGTNSNDFDFQVDLSTPDGHVIHFDLDINASNGGPWSDSFDVPVVCLNNPPNTPSNPSPTDGATNRDINVDLSWTGGDPDPGDTVTYDVYFEANDSTPDNLICDDASTPACDPGTLAYDTHYYWYVVATDNHGASTTGDTWDFHTGAAPNNPPHQPGNSMPADGATSVSITADLSWTGGDPDPGDTVTYDVYFEANDSTPDNLICDDASTPACDPGTLAYDTHYYWYVVATDNHGASTTGDTWDFTTQSAPPTVGPLVYDSHTIDDDNSGQSSGNGNGIVNCGETIELYVDLYNQGSSTATGVNAAISTSDPYVTSWLYNTESTYPDIPGGGTSTNSNDFDFQVDPSTPDGHVIHFDLDINASNGGPWSDSFDVPVVCLNNPPNTPSNPSPTDGATNRDVNVDLSWTGGDPDPGDTVTYDVYFEANDSTPDNLICDDASTPACDPGTLSYNSHYYWYVVATDNHGASTTGDTWDFHTGAAPNNPPHQPGNSMPADGATSVSITADLSWTGGDPDPGDTVTYDVYFEANDSTPDNLICDDASTPACDPGTLAYDTHYYWYVVATDNHGASTTGDTWDFTTQSAPPTVGPLVYDSHTVDDDNSGQSSGNGNGIVNSGETIELYVNLYNQGGNTATGVNAAISTSDPYVTWLYNTESTYPDIPGGGTSTNSDDFEFQVDPSTPDGHVIHFDLDISASNGGPWSDSFDVPVACECYNLNTSVNPIGSGNITASPPPNCGGGQYTAGAQVQLTANPASGYNFSHWSGDASSSANPITVTMDGNKLVTASFTQPCYSLSTSVSPSGSVSVDPSPNCGSDQYTAGTQVQLTANPPPGYNFSHWSGDASGSANPTTVTMDGDKSVTANFIAAEPPEEFKIYLPTVARHYPGMIQVRFALRNR